jgi:uncharacterized protein YhbP (UPF0306 family)
MAVRFESDRVSGTRIRRSLTEILDETALCSIASVGPGNRAHVNTAYFAWSSDFDLFFLSDPSAGHVRNFHTRPTAAVTVFRSTQRWGGSDRGAQLFGTAREAAGRIARVAERSYANRFSRYTPWIAGSGIDATSADRLRSYRFYRFRPTRVKILDEETFGAAVFIEAKILRSR